MYRIRATRKLERSARSGPKRMARNSKTKKDTAARYAAPALEKGLDILELMAAHGGALGQSEIARSLERTPAEIFRMLNCLERRSYLERDPSDERYRLSARLFELAHHHPPTRLLLDSALPRMRELASELGQSCHLAIRHDDHALVVAQVDNPGFIGFSVRVGAQAALLTSCSGHVLLSFAEPGLDQGLMAALEPAARTQLLEHLGLIRDRGYEEIASAVVQGITDVGAPVLGREGVALAALTVPCLTPMGESHTHAAVRLAVRRAAGRISSTLGGASPAEGGSVRIELSKGV
jgi:DNA-binding IclR family transcriptional regulator